MVVIFLPPTALTGTEHERMRHAVDMHGAGAALRDAAAVFGAGEADGVAQHPQTAACSGSTSMSCDFR